MNTLDELFSTDPLKLSDEDVSHIVSELRKQRQNFKEAEAKAAASGKRVKASGPVETLSLEGLGL